MLGLNYVNTTIIAIGARVCCLMQRIQNQLSQRVKSEARREVAIQKWKNKRLAALVTLSNTTT